MRNPERIDRMLKLLEVYWKANPDLRLGQLVSNAGYIAVKGKYGLFNVEDDLMENQLAKDVADDYLSRGLKKTDQ